MTKKQFNKVLSMHKNGLSDIICIAAIIEMNPHSIIAAENIIEFLLKTSSQLITIKEESL